MGHFKWKVVQDIVLETKRHQNLSFCSPRSIELMGSEVTLVKKLKQGLGCIRELTAVLEVLVRALDPCKQSDITEDMDSEGTTETFTDSET